MAPPPPSPNRNSDDSGCFSAIIHRLLCRSGVPTHPTSSEFNPAPRHSSNKTPPPPPPPVLLADHDVSSSVDEKPGIVARLMGLETLPDFTTRRLPAVYPSTVPRSRSVNFMDYLITAGGTLEHQHHHRRVRTSVSFREVVVPRQQKQQDDADEDLLVLYLDELTVAAAESSISSSTLDRVPNSSSSSSISNYKGGSKNAAGKEFKLHKKNMNKDGKLFRDDDEKKKKKKKVVVISKLKSKEEQFRNRGKSSSSSSSSSMSRVKDGARANREAERPEFIKKKKKKKDDNCKRRGAAAAAGRLIHDHKEVVAESNFLFITKKKTSCRNISAANNNSSNKKVVAKPNRLEDDIKNYDTSTPEDMKRKLSSVTSWRHDCSSPETFPERINEQTGELLDTPEITHNYSLAAALDHVCKLTQEDIISNYKYAAFGTKLEDQPEYEDICVMIEHRILNIIIQQLVGDLLPLN